jgi:translation elongation factor EF-Ts
MEYIEKGNYDKAVEILDDLAARGYAEAQKTIDNLKREGKI